MLESSCLRTFGVLCSALLVFGCGQKRVSITAAGSTAFQPFAEKLAEQFMQQHPDIEVNVQGGGSMVGVRAALSGAAEIGMADLVTLPPETAEMNSVAVARDSIALVVHPSNPLENLTTEQVRDVFGGRIGNWKDLGGADHEINVVSREAGSGTRASFDQVVGDISLAPRALVQDSNGTIRETVANDAHAIGYLSHGLINDRIKPVRYNGRDCTTEAVIAGEYELVRPVYLLTRKNAPAAVSNFVAYVLSSEGQGTIRECGLIPVK